MYNIGEVWYTKFLLEEDPSSYLERPAIIVDIAFPNLVIIKITKHIPRGNGPFDTLNTFLNY